MKPVWPCYKGSSKGLSSLSYSSRCFGRGLSRFSLPRRSRRRAKQRAARVRKPSGSRISNTRAACRLKSFHCFAFFSFIFFFSSSPALRRGGWIWGCSELLGLRLLEPQLLPFVLGDFLRPSGWTWSLEDEFALGQGLLDCRLVTWNQVMS